ncbi:TOMM precursor leader peptide-binding protein, partial [Crossiella equi]
GGVVGYDDVGCGFGEEDVGRSRALAVAAHLRRQAPSVRTGPAGRRRVADVVVLTDWHAPEPEVLGALMADRVTHLPVRVTEGVGVVGPLVRPRRGACLQCVELRRAAGDPHWSRLSAQLLHHVPAPDLPTAHTAAALTAAQVLLALSWHEGHDAPPPSWSTVLTVDPLALTAHREVISAHPDCPCGAASSRPDYM